MDKIKKKWQQSHIPRGKRYSKVPQDNFCISLIFVLYVKTDIAKPRSHCHDSFSTNCSESGFMTKKRQGQYSSFWITKTIVTEIARVLRGTSNVLKTVMVPWWITKIFVYARWGVLDSIRFDLVRSCSLQFVEPRSVSPLPSSLSVAAMPSVLRRKGSLYFSCNILKYSWTCTQILIELPVFYKLITRCPIALCHCLHKCWLQKDRWDLMEFLCLR